VGWVQRWVRGTCTGVWMAIQASQTSRLFALVNVANPNAPLTPLRATDLQLFSCSVHSYSFRKPAHTSSVCVNRPSCLCKWVGLERNGIRTPTRRSSGGILGHGVHHHCIGTSFVHLLLSNTSDCPLGAKAETHTYTQTAQPCQPMVCCGSHHTTCTLPSTTCHAS
jgi:hypothetical protein